MPITLHFVQFCATSSTTMMLAALRFQESRCKNLSGFFTLCLFVQQHDTADKCSGWLSNPGFQSSSTDSQFVVICKCKEWTLHYHKDHHWKEEAMTVIAQNVLPILEANLFYLPLKQISNICTFICIFACRVFPLIACENNTEKTELKAYLITTVCSLSFCKTCLHTAERDLIDWKRVSTNFFFFSSRLIVKYDYLKNS